MQPDPAPHGLHDFLEDVGKVERILWFLWMFPKKNVEQICWCSAQRHVQTMLTSLIMVNNILETNQAIKALLSFGETNSCTTSHESAETLRPLNGSLILGHLFPLVTNKLVYISN